MRREVLLALHVILLFNLGNCQSDTCQSNADCDNWLTCVEGVCTWCSRPGATCESGSFSQGCCPGTICQEVQGLNSSICMPSQCSNDSDCPSGYGCLLRLGKCGLCHADGERCTLPYDTLECCSSWCALSGVEGVCKNPYSWHASTPRPKSKGWWGWSAIYSTAPTSPTNETSTRPPILLTGRSCTTISDCPGFQDCYNGYGCTHCQRLHTFCQDNSDCCSYNCSLDHNYTQHHHLRNHTLCA